MDSGKVEANPRLLPPGLSSFNQMRRREPRLHSLGTKRALLIDPEAVRCWGGEGLVPGQESVATTPSPAHLTVASVAPGVTAARLVPK